MDKALEILSILPYTSPQISAVSLQVDLVDVAKTCQGCEGCDGCRACKACTVTA